MQAYHVAFRNPSGTMLTWIVVRDFPDDSISPEMVADVRASILAAHGGYWRSVDILEIRHLDRAMVSLASRDGAISRLQGGFGGAMYRAERA